MMLRFLWIFFAFDTLLSAATIDNIPIRPLFTSSSSLLFPSNTQNLLLPPSLPKEEAVDLFALHYIPNPIPAQLSSKEKTYFDYMNRCCTQNCCSKKLTGHTYDGLADEYGCESFEDYFCCCCLCCCCEEDYYGEGIGAGAGAGYGAGYGAGVGYGTGPGFGGTAGGFDPTPGPGEGPGLVADAGGFDPTPGPSVIIPEPSIYLILVSGLLIAIYVVRIRKKRSI